MVDAWRAARWMLAAGWMIVIITALVLLNAFFVAAEFAIVKVRATQIKARAARGDARALTAQHVVQNLDAYLSACQLGITLASLGLGWVGEPFVAEAIAGPLEGLGVGSPVALHAVAFGIALFAITFVHIVVGEQAPKYFAIERAEAVTLWTAWPLRAFRVLFRPFIWFLNESANLLLRLVGVRPGGGGHAATHSADELRMLLAEAGERNVIEAEPAKLMLRAFHLPELTAHDVMTPRTRVVWLDAMRPLEDALARAKQAGYSRYLVGEHDIDHVLGFVHYRDLVDLSEGGDLRGKDLRSVVRPVLFVPETAPLERILNTLLRRGAHVACVQEESSGTAGLITLEDIFEELFGEIRDEFDEGEPDPIVRYESGRVVVSGSLALRQAVDELRIEAPDSDASTVGGFVTEALGRVPARGERFALGPYEGLVREADKKRVLSVELWPAAGSSGDRRELRE